MTTSIYICNDNNIEVYKASINIEELKKLQKIIDKSYGKGDVKRKRTSSNFLYDSSKKIEVLSKKQVGVGISGSCPVCCSMPHEVSVFEYRYYEYEQHFLSKICDFFIKNENTKPSIEFSQYLNQLLNYKPMTKKDRKYYYQTLSCFDLKKITTEEIIESEISLSEKISILTKIRTFYGRYKIFNNSNFKGIIPKPKLDLKNILTSVPAVTEKCHIPKSYEELINKEIEFQHFLADKTKFSDEIFQFRTENKNEIHQRLIKTLPSKEQIEKVI